jgi:hypothetical protein
MIAMEDDDPFTLYSIIPSGEIRDSDVTATAVWPREHGATWDPAAARGRRPTAREIRAALNGFPGYRVTYDSGPSRIRAIVETLEAHARRPAAILELRDFQGDEQAPVDLRFTRGLPALILRIVEALSRSCGSLIVLANDDLPAFVTSGTEPAAAAAVWLPEWVIRAEKYELWKPRGIDDILAFLAEYEGDVDYKAISQGVIDWYVEAYDYFCQHPGPPMIRAFLMSFGNGSGAGIDDSINSSFDSFPKEVMLPILHDALASLHAGVRHRAIWIGSEYPDATLDPVYQELLRSSDWDQRMPAAYYMKHRGTPEAARLAAEALGRETEDDVREVLEESAAMFGQPEDLS